MVEKKYGSRCMQPILKAAARVQRKYEERREYRCRTHIKLLASQQGVNLNQEKAKDTNRSGLFV